MNSKESKGANPFLFGLIVVLGVLVISFAACGEDVPEQPAASEAIDLNENNEAQEILEAPVAEKTMLMDPDEAFTRMKEAVFSSHAKTFIINFIEPYYNIYDEMDEHKWAAICGRIDVKTKPFQGESYTMRDGRFIYAFSTVNDNRGAIEYEKPNMGRIDGSEGPSHSDNYQLDSFRSNWNEQCETSIKRIEL